jgi:hypothetical protein
VRVKRSEPCGVVNKGPILPANISRVPYKLQRIWVITVNTARQGVPGTQSRLTPFDPDRPNSPDSMVSERVAS